ncbi:MAG: hypothetical protein U1E53_21170 [Dongiaceae bacterium]
MAETVQDGCEGRGAWPRSAGHRGATYLGVGVALVAWLAVEIGITILIARDPTNRTTFPVYREAVGAWIARHQIYGPGIHGFLYFPPSLALAAPFVRLGQPLFHADRRSAAPA